MRFEIPDDALAEDHRARLLWRVVETLDLSAFTAAAKAVEGHAGRPLASVKMLLVLWMYVFTDVLGVLLHKGLLSLDVVALDGTRIRASATAPSFRGEQSLEACREQAALHVRGVLAEGDDPDTSAAEKAARLAQRPSTINAVSTRHSSRSGGSETRARRSLAHPPRTPMPA